MTKNTKKKSSGSNYGILILLAVIAVIAIGCGLFYANSKSEKDVFDDKPKDEAKTVSLLDESIEAQRLLDNILLQKNNWQLIENDHSKKEVEVDGSTAKVEINQRELAVGVPETTSLTGAAEWLQEKVEGAGLVYISGKGAKYKKWDAYKVEVGIKVKAGQGSKNFVTDTITLFHNANLKKQDKDIKDLPEAKVEDEEQQGTVRQFRGKVAIVIDDCGADMSSVRTLLDTGLPFSYAILPNKQYSSDVLELVKARGRVPMLHLPMEPLDASAMSEGANTIRVAQTPGQKLALLRKHLASLQGVVGVNNHQGSRATSDRATMRTVIGELRSQGFFFLDSRTASTSVGNSVAREMGVPTARNDIFLDNSSDVEAIRAQVYKALAIADKNGSVIAICHARPNTAQCWKKYASEFKKTGVTFVPVTELLY